jgi:hypothetical protein
MRRHSFLGRRSDIGLVVGDAVLLLLLVVVRTDADDSSKEEAWKGRGMMTRNMKIVIIEIILRGAEPLCGGTVLLAAVREVRYNMRVNFTPYRVAVILPNGMFGLSGTFMASEGEWSQSWASHERSRMFAGRGGCFTGPPKPPTKSS